MPSEVLNDALLLAQEYRVRAYAPYSGYTVGAVVIAENGETFGGVNVENASYGLTICAERAAVAGAVSAGHRRLKAVAIAGPPQSTSSPCGACRQVLREFGSGLRVLYTSRGGLVEATLEDLLPDAFGPHL